MKVKRIYKKPKQTSFLFGPRGVGKSTWVRETLHPDLEVDLLKTSTFLELQRNPSRLEALISASSENKLVFIDEIQKLPSLLDEVHRLIEKKKVQFIITGSSARKLKKMGVNLLGGRAHTKKMYPFTLKELGDRFSIEDLLKYGTLPIVLRDLDGANETLLSYVETYLKEEIKEEALVRRVDEFSRFLEVASILNGQVMNVQNICSEVGKSNPTLQSWFQILEDTLLGARVAAYQPGLKVRETSHQKFYLFDPGVARAGAGLLNQPADKSWLGFAFEALILNELRVYNEVSNLQYPISYYGTPTGEIDFIIQTKKKVMKSPGEFISIEVKLSKKWKSDFEKPSRSLQAVAKSQHRRMIGVYLGDEKLKFNGFEVYPVHSFVEALHSGEFY